MSASASVTRPAPLQAQRAPAGSAQRVVAVYLAVTAPLLLAGDPTPVALGIVGLHAVIAWGLWRDRPTARSSATLWDWAPLLLAPLLYWELPRLMEGLPGPVVYHDPAIVVAERALFGMQPAYDWAGAMPWLPLSELLHACYLSYYLLIYAPPLLVYLGVSIGPGRSAELGRRGDSPAFRETVLAVMLAFLSCYVVFVVMPVQGPRYLGVPAGVPSGPFRALVLDVLEAGSSRGAAFPSSHVSVSIAQALVALRLQPRVGHRILPIAIGLAAGAVYGGFHYGIDALVGAVVGVAAALAAGPLRRRIEGPDTGFTKAPGAV